MPKQNNGIEWIGRIPITWELKKIKFLLKQRIEKNNPVQTKDILSLTAKQGVIPLSEKEGGGNKPKEDITGYVLAYPGDIVMNSMNVLSGSVGLSKYFGCVSPVYYMLKPLSSNDDVRFYNYIFQTKDFQNSLLGLGNGILIKESDNGKYNTIRMRIPIDKLFNLMLPSVSPVVQNNIADLLDIKCAEIDSLYADIEKQIDVLEQYKKSVITEAVTKGFDQNVEMKDSGVEWIGKIQKDWTVKKLKYVSANRDVKVANNNGNDYFALENIVSWCGKYISTGNEYDTTGAIYCKKNDVVFGKLRPYLAKVFYVDFDRCCSSEFAVFCDFCGISKFLYYIMISDGFVNTVDMSTYGIKMPRANIGFINNMYIPYPSVQEQQSIVDYLDTKCAEIDSVIEDKKKQLETLEAYKKSLIYEYVTGKKEVSA